MLLVAGLALSAGAPGLERELLQRFAELQGLELEVAPVKDPVAALDDYVANVRRTPTRGRLVVKYFGESGLEILKKSR